MNNMIAWIIPTLHKLLRKDLQQAKGTAHQSDLASQTRVEAHADAWTARNASPPAVNSTPSRESNRPLRIIQWVESSGASAPSAGRLVMAGKFSEICAELERMAALEGA